MKGAWPAAAIRIAEAAVIAEIGEEAIMRRAAYGLSIHCGRILHRVYGAPVVLLIGAGSNGGDALYAGVELLRRGAAVRAVLLSPERAHTGGLLAFVSAGGVVAGPSADPAGTDLVVDGITGIGGRGELRPDAAALVAGLDPARVVAVDLPSGVDADTGHVAGAAVRAGHTVTFGALKPGLLVGAGQVHSGAVSLVDIGLGPHLPEPFARVLEPADVAALLPVPRPADDKYGQGVVGVVAGSPAYPGAAVLTVGAALRGKPGMVRYAGPVADAVGARWPEAVVSTGRPGQAGRVQLWVIGPGLGTDEAAGEVLREVLATDLPVLIDADGLAPLADHPSLVRDRDAPTVLTPHDREFERLFGPVGEDRLGSAERAAAQIGATVLLKGQATIVADPSGRAYVNTTGSGWLATAGTGDALSGLAGALLAAGGDTATVAAAAAYLHGVAGSIAGGSIERGAPVTAMDVVQAIPAAIRRVRAAPI
ncbi:bifunctional ADP-dependent NAD(P)H-hydrate dehydratase/NAD(P)H-hydrate epimerase [soil metagenome]